MLLVKILLWTGGLHLNKLDIFSDKESYDLFFNAPKDELIKVLNDTNAIVIDKNVLDLYSEELEIDKNKVILVHAFEDKKRPDISLDICNQLMLKGVTRHDTIVAIGGGITQDLVTFAASILFRGIKWIWLPTTLLAQADSCIGGKSSLNFKSWKNILGNIYPPYKIYIQDNFLKTLSDDDLRSGIGEILKVHLLSGKHIADTFIEKMNRYKNDKSILSDLILNSLILKNRILEIDPLDKGLRLKMNYGHSFGHALESATNFGVPHGIAVTMGLDMANFVAVKQGNLTKDEFSTLHDLLAKNLKSSDFIKFDFCDFIKALKKDKKNDHRNYKLIIPVAFGEVELTSFEMIGEINEIIKSYFAQYYQKGNS